MKNRILISINNGMDTASVKDLNSLAAEFKKFLLDKRQPMHYHNVDKGIKIAWY